MEVLGNVFLKVDVNPSSVIQKLIDEEIGAGSFVVKMNNKYYISVISGNVTVQNVLLELEPSVCAASSKLGAKA